MQVETGRVITDHWPLFGLRIRTPRLELRLPSLEDLAALADLAVGLVHDPAVQPFTTEWTDVAPAERGRSVVQFHWSTLANWTVEDWTLQLVVVAGGQVVGTQGISARSLATVREVSMGSWLGRAHQGRGFGTEMRAAVLHLGFVGLEAEWALSGAFIDNPASLAVSRRLGYLPDGIVRRPVRGRAAVEQRLRLDREQWAEHRTLEAVAVTGLEPCLPLFGAV